MPTTNFPPMPSHDFRQHAAGLAVDGESIPYVAGWGEHGALEAVMEFAETIDTLARRLEEAVSDPVGEPASA
jgi:hypothetical protein